jgi:hypothetical protein
MPPAPHSATERSVVSPESFHGVGRSRLVNARSGVGAGPRLGLAARARLWEYRPAGCVV